jgi:hypothetical protein
MNSCARQPLAIDTRLRECQVKCNHKERSQVVTANVARERMVTKKDMRESGLVEVDGCRGNGELVGRSVVDECISSNRDERIG